MPEDALITHIPSKKTCFVVRTYKVAILTWPAEQLALNLWSFDKSVTRLDWKCIFDLDDWEVIPTQYVCPMRLYNEDCCCCLLCVA